MLTTARLKVGAGSADKDGMTHSLYRSLAARLIVVVVAASTLGGLATHAAATRPDPIVWHWTTETP